MIQQHNLLIRPSRLSEPSQLALLTPWKTKHRNFSRFAFYGGQGLLPAGQILVVLLGSRGVLFYSFCPCWEVLPIVLGHGDQPIHNLSALVCPTQPRCPPLSWASRQSKGSAVGSGSAADWQQLPWGWWINTPELNSTALWHPELTFHSVRHLILWLQVTSSVKRSSSYKIKITLHLLHSDYNLCLMSHKPECKLPNFESLKEGILIVSQPKQLWTLLEV